MVDILSEKVIEIENLSLTTPKIKVTIAPVSLQFKQSIK